MIDYPLRSCVWEITLSCCFRCRYCGSKGGVAREGELTTAECLDVVKQLKELGCRRVSLIGGEVFMRSDWETIVLSLTEAGIRTCIITNGFAMTPALLDKLKRAKVESVAVSLDGPQRVHDPYRQEGSYERALLSIRALTEAGIPTSVISALRADNAPLLPELYETLRPLPIFAWQLQACSPMGNARDNALDVAFDVDKVVRFVLSTAPTAPFAVGIADNIGYYTEGETQGLLRGGRGAFFTGCGAGLTSIGIDSVGNVRGCESMYDPAFIEGNLREKSLKEIWQDPHAFGYNRDFTPDLLDGKCAECPHGNVCAGGCRSYNYFTNPDHHLYRAPACAKR